MLEAKIFEVRDRCTLMAVLATKLTSGNSKERQLAHREGFFGGGPNMVIVTKLNNLHTYCDPYTCESEEVGRTMSVAMQYIQAGFETLQSGEVIDVEFILKETAQPKESEYK